MPSRTAPLGPDIRTWRVVCHRPALAIGAGALFLASGAAACHEFHSDWMKVADPGGYAFCAYVFKHLDSSGLGPEISEAEQRHGHGCHLDCQPPGDGFLMGHQHGITLPDGGCNIEVIQACQLAALPPRGNRAIEGWTIPDRPRPPRPPFDR